LSLLVAFLHATLACLSPSIQFRLEVFPTIKRVKLA
jgi:hypothetical protein